MNRFRLKSCDLLSCCPLYAIRYTPDEDRFTGQYYDSEINEYYLRARQYDPHIGRFTARDLIDGKFEEPLTLHKYLYCINNPINRIDPEGLWGTAIHNQIIDAAYIPFSKKIREQIYEGSRWCDGIFYQDAEDAYAHAMRAPWQSIEEAQEVMWRFVFQNLRSYKEYLNSGRKDLAYEHLGRAMHPIMDWTCAAHDWKDWRLRWRYARAHHDPETIDRGTLNTTVSMMEQAMAFFEVSEILKLAGW